MTNKQTPLIGGHTDEEGDLAAQEELSLTIAEAAKAYLVALGHE